MQISVATTIITKCHGKVQKNDLYLEYELLSVAYKYKILFLNNYHILQ